MTLGSNTNNSIATPNIAEYYDSYSVDEIPENVRPYISNNDDEEIQEISNSVVINHKETPKPLDAPMDSPWPMYCHDVRHTGRSPYSTAGNPGLEKWRFELSHEVNGGVAIDDDGTIYFGSDGVYAVNPNGTLKWKYITHFKADGTPVLAEDGTIYFGTVHGGFDFYALYPDGTLKWALDIDSVYSSPTIGEDGTIYFGCLNQNIYALNPNGTIKWLYPTKNVVYSSPAIGLDGVIYCGSHDGNLYALYPNNGTLKWKYSTGDWVARGPCVADDGTVYFGSWDGYLYACYPNGTLKWKTNVGVSTTPVIALDGTIYVGFNYLSAIYPNNGSVKWRFDPGPRTTIRGGNPCISNDGTIFFGTHIGETDGGELIALNSDGTERWRIMLATTWIWSAPAIGEDGTVYIGSCNDVPPSSNWGYLHAIGELDPDAPSAPDINGPPSGRPKREYDYTFTSTSPLDKDVYYWIEWGDGNIEGWIGPYDSGEVITRSHTWSDQGTYTIKARAKDSDNLWGPWGELEVTMPRNKATSSSLFLRLLERFPNAFPIIRQLLGL